MAQKYSPINLPSVVLAGAALQMVRRFNYLGHTMTEALNSDLDVKRERIGSVE